MKGEPNMFFRDYGSRFAEESEIIDISATTKCDANKFGAGGVPILSDGKTMNVINDDSHSLIFGATGSMKSRRVIMPTVMSLIMSGESLILNDPKGELHRRFTGLLNKQGYCTIVLNFRDSYKGSRWNPLSIAYNYYKEGKVDKSTECIRDIASCIYSELVETNDDAFWAYTAIDYFVGLALLLRDIVEEDEFTIENINLTHSFGEERLESSRYINKYCNMIDEYNDAIVHLRGTINAPNETRSSIHSVFSQPLSLYLQDNLRDMLCQSDFDVLSIGKRKTAIFLITPDERSAYNPIITTFIKQCYGSLIEMAYSEELGELPIRVNFILDEFSNLPAIPDFNNMISAARSRNIRFYLVIQNLAQLYKAYSREIAETILTNCAVWHILRSKDNNLHELVQKICGNCFSDYGHVERPLVNAMTIQRLNKVRGEVLILIDGQYPFITELPDIDEYSFDLPAEPKAIFNMRKPKDRKQFDIRKAVFQLKREQHISRHKKVDSIIDILPKLSEQISLNDFLKHDFLKPTDYPDGPFRIPDE